MHRYEILYIIAPTVAPEEAKETALKYRDLVVDAEGEVLRLEDLGVRKLAYEVKGQLEGRYVLMVFLAPANIPGEIARQIRLDERVLRHMCVAETPRMARAVRAAKAAKEAQAAKAAEEAKAAEAAAAEAAAEETAKEAAPPEVEAEAPSPAPAEEAPEPEGEPEPAEESSPAGE